MLLANTDMPLSCSDGIVLYKSQVHPQLSVVNMRPPRSV